MQSVPRQVITLILAGLMLSLVAVAQTPPPPTASADTAKVKAESRAETNAVQDGQDKPSATKDGATQADSNKDQQNPESDIVPGKKKPTGPPTTKTLATPKEIVAADTLLAPPPPPKGKIALIGGEVKKIDQIRNRMEVSIFGGGKMKMNFDERSHFYRDNVEVTQLAVKKGDRVYVDSQLDQGKIFARSVRVQSERPIAAAGGQVIAYNPNSGDLTLREPISSKPLQFKVTPRTAFRRGDQPGAVADLRNNAIVRVTFLPVPGKRSELKDVDLIAIPGTKFTFYGRLTHIDLRNGLLGVENKADDRLYEVRFRPSSQTVNDQLVIGAEVNIVATFTGKDYAAESLQVTGAAAPREEEQD